MPKDGLLTQHKIPTKKAPQQQPKLSMVSSEMWKKAKLNYAQDVSRRCSSKDAEN